MSSSASVEIWHTILKYAISVPLFFDDDPVDAYGVHILQQYSYEAPYWHAERIRNSLRRVCHTWDDFLSPFAHRLVRLDDVLHRHVPVTALPLALRLDFTTTTWCECVENFSPHKNGFWAKMKHIWDTAPFASGDEGRTTKPIAWRVKIIKGSLITEEPYCSVLKERAPALKVMVTLPFEFFRSALDLPNQLRFLSTDVGDLRSLRVLSGAVSLTVLHVMVKNLNFLQNTGTLPSLKHLSIEMLGDRDFASQKQPFDFLERIGSQLSTFHHRLAGPPWSSQVEHKLWEMLPVVESIELPYIWSGVKVPPAHPLQQIQISVSVLPGRHLRMRGWEDNILPYLPLSGQDRQTVRMDLTWNDAFRRQSLPFDIQEHYRNMEIPFVDAHGDTFSQYVVFLITAFWKQPDRKYHKSNRGMEMESIPDF